MRTSGPLGAALVGLVLLGLGCTPAGWAQFGDTQQAGGVRMGQSGTTRWKVGVTVRAVGTSYKGLYGTIPVPTDWPEQQVRTLEEDITPTVKSVRYRTLGNGVRQMVVQVPNLRAGEEARALVTFEIVRQVILAPEHPETLRLAEDIAPEIRSYLAPSPYIEVRHPKIVALAKQLRNEQLSGWAQVEAIYDYVRENVQYKNGKLKGALAALQDGYGDCEELTSLFIALCRANGIPARTVWVPGHCYPEFHLADEEGTGHWFPCQAAGSRDFGGIPEQRPILQKGDNFQVPETRERQRYVAEFLKGSGPGGARPDHQFVRQLVNAP